MPISAPTGLEASADGIKLAQDVLLFGFPLGYYNEAEGLIMPFAGKGVLSAADFRTSGAVKYYLHATAVEGFSGGPMLFFDEKSKRLKIFGVVSGFETTRYPVVNGHLDTGMKAIANPGIMFGYDIKPVVEAINKNPIGPLIK